MDPSLAAEAEGLLDKATPQLSLSPGLDSLREALTFIAEANSYLGEALAIISKLKERAESLSSKSEELSRRISELEERLNNLFIQGLNVDIPRKMLADAKAKLERGDEESLTQAEAILNETEELLNYRGFVRLFRFI